MLSLMLMLCAFVGVALVSHRLRGFTYVAIGFIICTYVLYAYSHA